MVVFQDGRLKEVVNLQVSNLDAEELTFVKARMDDWDTPIAPSKPPTSDDWDATQVQNLGQPEGTQERFDGQVLMPEPVNSDPPAEAPQVEEIPENPRMMVEEILEQQPSNEEGDEGTNSLSGPLNPTTFFEDAAAPIASKITQPCEPSLEPAAGADQCRAARNTTMKSRSKERQKDERRSRPEMFPHAAMTLSEWSSEAGATYATSQVTSVWETLTGPRFR